MIKHQKFKVTSLIRNPKYIRNICILAHVDHGKTTLADNLLVTNGIISSRLAGKLRYMDNLEEEQARGITMKSSAVALLLEEPTESESSSSSVHLINLIDSPGHIDFSSEVSTAVRLCDGAVLLVDVVEGVCPQTRAVIRQSWQEQVKLVLVLNKIDRLILELKLSPEQAYRHLSHVIESVNSVMAELFAADVMAKQHTTDPVHSPNPKDNPDSRVYNWSSGLDSADDCNIYFSPDRGNIVFSSAWDGWGFRITDFARIYAQKLGCKLEVLEKTLWGDYYLSAGTKSDKKEAPKILKGAFVRGKKPLFVSMILEQIWNLYSSVLENDEAATNKIIKSLGLQVKPRDLRQQDKRNLLTCIIGQWLPLSKSVLSMVVEICPASNQLTEEKVECLLTSHKLSRHDLSQQWSSLKQSFLDCSSSSEKPTVVFVSKMFVVDKATLNNEYKPPTLEELKLKKEEAREAYKTAGEIKASENGLENKEIINDIDQEFIAFARVYSGRIYPGQKLFVLGPRYNPNKVNPALLDKKIDELPEGPLEGVKYVSIRRINKVYQLLSRELIPLDGWGMPAGNILGISGLSEDVIKSATLSDLLKCPSFSEMQNAAAPIVCVSVEPQSSHDISRLERALKLLEKADPSIEVKFESSGEILLYSAGEVHLDKCLNDLKKIYAPGLELQVSPFIVPFRETLTAPSQHQVTNNQTANPTFKHSFVSAFRPPNKPGLRLCIRLTARPMPQELIDFIENHQSELHRLVRFAKYGNYASHQDFKSLQDNLKSKLAELLSELKDSDWLPDKIIPFMWAFGPEPCGPNLLVNFISKLSTDSLFKNVNDEKSSSTPESEESFLSRHLRSYIRSIVNGFRLATSNGPLCGEPMRGVAFFIERVWEEEIIKDIGDEKDNEEDGVCIDKVKHLDDLNDQLGSSDRNGLQSTSGQLMAAVKSACLQAFQSSPQQRLMLAMYAVDLQVQGEVLGKMYAVLGRRHGNILSADLREGENIFIVQAVLPVIESFGLSDELRKKTSGLAQPQLRMSHWETFQYDPLTLPDDELGEGREDWFRVHRYIKAVRRRKGLVVREQLVESAEKQRNLSKKK